MIDFESKYHQRRFIPKNPRKYQGNHNMIINRSSWETIFAKWLDENDDVLQWSSEELAIPYKCATDNRFHRYFVDFKMTLKTKDGERKTFIVEIKPMAQTQVPKYPGRQTKRYLTESMTFAKNQSKWKAAQRYAKDRGWEFVIITEKELGIV